MTSTFKLHSAISILLLCLSSVGFAQQTTSPATSDDKTNKGIVAGKAIYLGKPVYPREAKINRIGGRVSVKITIDENGNVVAAKAETGDAVLHKAAEEAALKSKFTPTTLDGKPVKVTAGITFNFSLSDNWESAGYALSSIESGTAGKVYGKNMRDFSWQGFEEEKKEYDDLSKDESTEGKAERAKTLIKTIEEKLKIQNPTEYWHFKLGRLISKLSHNAEKFDGKADFQNYLKEFEVLVKDAAFFIPKERMDVLNEVVKYASKEDLTREERSKIAKLLTESYNQQILTR